jgi:hypothetical protein
MVSVGLGQGVIITTNLFFRLAHEGYEILDWRGLASEGKDDSLEKTVDANPFEARISPGALYDNFFEYMEVFLWDGPILDVTAWSINDGAPFAFLKEVHYWFELGGKLSHQ